MNTTTTSDRNVLSEKELNYLHDFLSWELLAVKKCNEVYNTVQDTEIKNMVKSIGQKHINHYNQLLTHLQ